MKNNNKKGITLLLVIVILSALVSISAGIFNVILGELMISGEIGESYVALYAADRAIDKFLYLDRSTGGGSLGGLRDGDLEDTTATPSSNGCYTVKIIKGPLNIGSQCNTTDALVCIKSVGLSRCGTASSRLVKRGFMVLY